ncbi:hypothetical protein AURDEDRAFT_176444 [Auricularia subglabra TFB-10046 SS5]|uniref:Uncharacterized protein n=1 Tax=Auricularia subglabra (strain TFB-10046 / SS5) TaxID=717982 RepID=J0D6N5_AURST|nr:hypothetical protein AURDEDRAFT_176444 [Auricularia subglabra TFB-10046 SS5]
MGRPPKNIEKERASSLRRYRASKEVVRTPRPPRETSLAALLPSTTQLLGVPPLYNERVTLASVHRALESDMGDWLHVSSESDVWRRFTTRLISSQRRGKPAQRLLEDIREQFIKVSRIHDVVEDALLEAWRLHDDDCQYEFGELSTISYSVSDALSELLSFYDAEGTVLSEAYDRQELAWQRME